MDFTIYAIGINLLRVVVLASKHKFLKAVFFAYILNISKFSDIWSSGKISKVLANPIPQGTFNVSHSHNRQRESEWILVRAYCVCVSIAAPLPGGTQLAALGTHDQKNGLESSDRRGICKNHGKSGSGRTWDWSEAILGGSGPVSCDGRGKAHRKWANGCAGKLFRNDSRIIRD